MSNSANNKKKLPGFYIALCCCVLAIGFGGFITKRDTQPEIIPMEEPTFIPDTESNNIPLPVSETIVVEEVEPTLEPTEQTDVITETAPEDASAEYTFENPDTQPTAIIVNAEEPYFHMPVGGKILAGYSDKLIYNEAMDDWRTHNGIDISAEVGSSVSACADGIIEDIFEDVYGHGVSIKHENGFTTKYMCLGGTEKFNIGDEIKAGEVVGTIGTQKGENVTAPHLHLEMYDGNTVLNPQQYLN